MRRAIRPFSRSAQSGVTLVELVIAIVILAVAVTGVLLAMTTTVQRSADPMIQQQGAAIAEAYLEEIMARSFSGTTGPPSSREDWDHVSAYDGLTDNPPRDQFNDPMPGVDDYTVSVDVGDGTIGGVGAGDALRVDVAVSHSDGTTIRVSGYKLDY